MTINPITTSSFSWGAVLTTEETLTNQSVTVTTTNVSDNTIININLNSQIYSGTILNNATVITIPSSALQDLQTVGVVETYTLEASSPQLLPVTSSAFSVEQGTSNIIRTRSPFFIRTPEETSANLDYFEISILIESGVFGTATNTQLRKTVTLTKKPINNENSVSVEISEIVNNYLSHNPFSILGTNRLAPNHQSLWVEVTTRAKESDGTTIGSPTVTLYLAQEGFNTYLEGANYTTVPNAMITADYIQYHIGTNIVIPVNTEYVNQLQFVNSAGGIGTQTISTTTNANNKIEYVSFSFADIVSIIVNYGVNQTRIIKVEEITECKYSVYKCTFLNRCGAFQEVFFFKKSTESLETKNENYNRSNFTAYLSFGDDRDPPVTEYIYNSYDTSTHTKRTYNANGVESLQLNTGFVNEAMNPTFEELMVSEFVYLTDSDNNKFAVNLKDSSLTYKTSLNDKMINYTMSFEKSFSYINNVR